MLEVRPGITTALTLVMTAKPTGRRTFFYYPGAHALQTPDDFNFEGTRKRILHLGLPGLHAKVDAILMTTLATILGAIPLALAVGAGAESRQQIGWVIVGGLLLGTFLTLSVVPVAYTLLARKVHHSAEEAAELAEREIMATNELDPAAG